MTKRVHRSADNKYHIGGKAYLHLVGSRRQVFEGYAYKTAGDLCKSDLVRNKYGRYVSRSKHVSATREKRLQKHGYTAVKGKFGAVKMTTIQRRGTARRGRTARRATRGGCGAMGGNGGEAHDTAAAAAAAAATGDSDLQEESGAPELEPDQKQSE